MRKVSAILLILLMLCGCGKGKNSDVQVTPDSGMTPARGGEIRLFCDMPDTLNPIVTGYVSVSEVMYLVYDGLFKTENDFSATPVLASGYTAQSGNTQYIIRLKSNIKFHDGSSFGAEDVVSTMDRIRESESVHRTKLSNVASYVVMDDGSVLFNLWTPDSNFPNMLDFPILPAEVNANGNNYLAENKYFYPVGTGKYAVADITADSLSLTVNSGYFDGVPYIEKVDIKYLKDNGIAKYSFEAMEFDVITTDLYSWGDTSISTDSNVVEYESNRLVYLGFDCSNTALNDKPVRKAVSTAINKQEIVSKYVYSHASVAHSPVNPNAYFANNEYVHTVYEPGKAKGELNSAEWLDLDGDGVLDKYFDDEMISLSFNLVVNGDNPTLASVADYISSSLLGEGIKINVVKLSYDEYVAAVQNGEFDMYLGRTDIADNCDVAFMLQTGGERNYFKYSSQEMEGALFNAKSAEGTHNVKNAYKVLDNVFKDECPLVPLYFETDGVFSSVRIKGDMNISRTGVFTGMNNAFINYAN